MSKIVYAMLGLTMVLSIVYGQQILPQTLYSTNYQFNTPNKWYYTDFSTPTIDRGVNSVNYVQSSTFPGQTPGLSFLQTIQGCIVYIASQIPAGAYNMSFYGRPTYFSLQLSPTDTPLHFRVEDSQANIIAEHKIPWGDGSQYQQPGIFSSEMFVPSPLTNGRIIFCKERNIPMAMGSDGSVFFTNYSFFFLRGADGIPNCLSTKYSNTKKYCDICYPGYVLDSANMCAPKVDYCSVYKNRLCDVCITGFFLKDNTCVRQSPECQQTDSKGLCTQCQSGFSVKQGICAKDPVIVNCPASEYKNTDGLCVEGDISNCVKYVSPSGQCETCISGYTVNSQGQCVFTCPPQTETKKFVLVNGKCVGTDINCDLLNGDGSCAVCFTGFYVSQGKCIRQGLSSSSSTVSVSSSQDLELREDSSNNFYVQRPDGSRLYLNGPYKNLQVWTDVSDSLYVKVANGGRQYLTGPYERLYAYEDATGKWFVINNQGRKVFIEN